MTERTAASSDGPWVVDTLLRLPDEVIEAMFLLSAASIGFVMNVIVVTSVVTARRRRTVGSVFVVHGCLLDAVKCLYSVPFATSLLRRGPPDSCAVLGGSFVLLVTASAVNILATVCGEAYSFRSGRHMRTFSVSHIRASGELNRLTGPDYGTGNTGKCLGPTTSKGSTKDGSKFFEHDVSQSISNVICIVNTKTRNNALTVRVIKKQAIQHCVKGDRSHRRETEGLRFYRA